MSEQHQQEQCVDCNKIFEVISDKDVTGEVVYCPFCGGADIENFEGKINLELFRDDEDEEDDN